ncbi:MAG: hypothetical protein ACFFDI_07685 [Promethearchaeota archaeon]
MSIKSTCKLCGGYAEETEVTGVDAYYLDCENCGKYLFHEFLEKDYEDLLKDKEIREKLSAYTKRHYEVTGEPADLDEPEKIEFKIEEFNKKHKE